MSDKKEKSVSGNAFDYKLLKRILDYARPYRRTLVLSIAVTVVLAFLSIGRPLLTRYTLNEVVITRDHQFLLNMTLLMCGLLLTEALLQFANIYFTNWLGQNIIRDIRVKLYKKISTFRPKYFDNTSIGTLVTRVISDIEAIADIFSQGFIVIIGDILTLVVFIVTMFAVNWKLALIVLITVPILLVATNIFKNAVKSAFQDVRTQVARLNAFVQEHITGMKIVQVFNREEAEMKRFKEINAKHRDANIRSVWHYSVFFPVVEILSSVSLGLLIWYGGKEVFSGNIEAGDITLFIMLINMLFRPIRLLADRINTLQMGMVASERVFKVMDTEEAIEDKGVQPVTHVKGKIEFRNVWFAYNNEDWVLKDVSFKVNPGETVALVGATGSGKTSIINLLNRFYEYNKGEICIDNINVRDYRLQELRSNIGVVLQDVFLFSGSIADNISLNNPGITRERIIEASKIVGADEFISKLPGSYDYNVMERGAMLSVGQRQLIAFIRAYVYNPGILVLDEATSSIDTESEQMIQHAIDKLTENRTSIVIAHRLATIQKADRIIVMEKGQILETGNHQELLRKNGQYKKLFELQFKNEKVVI
jgi:ATP-binding cassette, subfamily B, multidrug efflux pump